MSVILGILMAPNVCTLCPEAKATSVAALQLRAMSGSWSLGGPAYTCSRQPTDPKFLVVSLLVAEIETRLS